jgi:hypothetical protein
MNKDKLYYVFRPGTNERKINPSGEPLIIQSEIINEILSVLPGYDIITIEKFEKIFGD